MRHRRMEKLNLQNVPALVYPRLQKRRSVFERKPRTARVRLEIVRACGYQHVVRTRFKLVARHILEFAVAHLAVEHFGYDGYARVGTNAQNTFRNRLRLIYAQLVGVRHLRLQVRRRVRVAVYQHEIANAAARQIFRVRTRAAAAHEYHLFVGDYRPRVQRREFVGGRLLRRRRRCPPELFSSRRHTEKIDNPVARLLRYRGIQIPAVAHVRVLAFYDGRARRIIIASLDVQNIAFGIDAHGDKRELALAAQPLYVFEPLGTVAVKPREAFGAVDARKPLFEILGVGLVVHRVSDYTHVCRGVDSLYSARRVVGDIPAELAVIGKRTEVAILDFFGVEQYEIAHALARQQYRGVRRMAHVNKHDGVCGIPLSIENARYYLALVLAAVVYYVHTILAYAHRPAALTLGFKRAHGKFAAARSALNYGKIQAPRSLHSAKQLVYRFLVGRRISARMTAHAHGQARIPAGVRMNKAQKVRARLIMQPNLLVDKRGVRRVRAAAATAAVVVHKIGDGIAAVVRQQDSALLGELSAERAFYSFVNRTVNTHGYLLVFLDTA